jgi:pimeloyl-ACP methyl ester carboxylesterase
MRVRCSVTFFVISVLFICLPLDAQEQGTVPLTNVPGEDAIHPDWSPKGDAISFISNRGSNNGRMRDVWTVAPDGSNPRRLTVMPDDGFEIGTYDAHWIGQTGDLVVYDTNSIYEWLRFQLSQNPALPVARTVLNGPSPFFQELLVIPGGLGGNTFTASRDGQYAGWDIMITQASNCPWVSNAVVSPFSTLTGQNTTDVGFQLATSSFGCNQAPKSEAIVGMSLSPDNTQLVLARAPDPNFLGFDLEIYDVSGGLVRKLTNNGSGPTPVINWQPRWSPDGRRIAFASNIGGQFQIYTINNDGSNLKPVTFSGGDWPTWSPDSSKIAFQSTRGGNSEIYVISTPLAALPKPTGLGASVGVGAVYLRWTPYPFLVDRFEVAVGQVSSSAITPIGTFPCLKSVPQTPSQIPPPTDACLVDSTLIKQPVIPGDTYQFSVRAVAGNIPSEFSDPVSASPNQFCCANKPPKQNPIIFLHGFLGDGNTGGTWQDTINFMTQTLGWKYGGELYHRGGDLVPTRVDRLGGCTPSNSIADFIPFDDITGCADDISIDPTNPRPDFFTVGFGNNLANYSGASQGLSHQGDEVAKFVQKLIDDGIPTPYIFVAHSNGGLAARDYLTRPSANPRDVPPISKLVTYGTPHRGADVQQLADNLRSPVTALICSPLPSQSCVDAVNSLVKHLESSDGAKDASFACNPPGVPGGTVTYPSDFLNTLTARSFPVSPTKYVAIQGVSTANFLIPFYNVGNRQLDCHSATWDGLVPYDSADLGQIENPPPSTTLRTFRTDRNHLEEGHDFPAILCALDDNCLVAQVMSPVNIRVTAPNGFAISNNFASMPGAEYMNVVDSNGHETATVLVPFPQGGQYTITATPKPGAQPTDTFTITLTQNGVTTTIANNIMIQDIPASGFHPHVNSSPVANAGPDQTFECKGSKGISATLNGSASKDPDGDKLTYQWTDSQGNVIAKTAVAKITAFMGTQTYSLVVTDPLGAASTAQTHVTVRDTMPPRIEVSLSPRLLRAGDNQMTTVKATIFVDDLCDPNPLVTLVSIKSDDPADDATDIQGAAFGTDDRSFSLRARQRARGVRRTYTVTYRVTDHSGNTATATGKVYVPRDDDDKCDD